MINIDWGVVATIVVIAKGLWDIYKERHKPRIDLSTVDNNIAEAANISVKSLLETLAQVQKRLEQMELLEKRSRNDLQVMGQSLGKLRLEREKHLKLLEQLMRFSGGLLTRLSVLGQSLEEDRKQYEELKSEVDKIGTQPL